VINDGLKPGERIVVEGDKKCATALRSAFHGPAEPPVAETPKTAKE